MRRASVLLVLALAGCPTPTPETDAGFDAGFDAGEVDSGSDAGLPAQTSRLRIINGCETDPLWVFYLIGSGGGSLASATPNQIELAPGGFYDYPIPDIGVAATRFWPGFDCDATGNGCTIGQSGGPAADGFSCPTDGCAPPIDSKFEGTFGCLPGVLAETCQINPSSPTGMRLPATDSWDTSMVDGFTLPYRVRVLDECAGGPMGGEIDCSTLPMSECPTSENLSTGGMYPEYADVSMVATNPSDMDPAGCYSDCGRLTYDQWGVTPGLSPSDAPAQAYCCPTPPVSPEACRMGPVATSGYTELVHRTCPQVYAYAYDDGTGLWGCPAGTRYEVTFYCPQ
jgi:hypothetical protein